MSDTLAASFPVGTIDASLTEIDNKSKEASATEEDLTFGPFGVINFSRPVTEEAVELQTASKDAPVDLPSAGGEPMLDNITPITMDSWMGLDDTLQWADLFGFGSDNIFPPAHNILDPLLDLNNQTALFIEPETLSNDQDTSHYHHALSGAGSRLTQMEHQMTLSNELLNGAQPFLKHFQDTVVHRLAALPVPSKSPWKMIIFREAINTLSHLTFLDSKAVTCAKKATLNGVLAISAYHLSRNPSETERIPGLPNDIHHFVNMASAEAKSNLQQSLKHELHGPSKAKYKDQLMAILCLLALAVLAGYQKDARCYLIDAERLLRHRGLAKREVSRKSRLLHHIYTWCRILGESTFVLHEHSNAAADISSTAAPGPVPGCLVVPSSGPGSRLDDFLRLEPHHSDSELDIEETKEPQTSIRDIHLEDSRDNPNTMYTDIYGITETWLSLLSQTTRLANRMDGLKAAGAKSDTAISDVLARRASRLEDMICTFASQFTPRSSTPKWEPNNHMHTALNSALVIFFYRRIRNVNSWILQSHVDDVIAALDRFDRSIADQAWEGPGTPWPAFIAAAEASTQNKRERLFGWIEKAEATTGFNCYTCSKNLLLEVWKRRDDGGAAFDDTPGSGTRKSARRSRTSQANVSWLDICREQKRWLMAF